MKFVHFILCSVLVHVVLFGSIFDIYFTSPLVRDVTSIPIDPHVKTAAHRLVLFVADGLRADKFYEDDNRAPFLRNVIQRKGTWGVSHTHIPTESRPGHVALIAGFYEDVSAVMRGWKENPVEFDSVFNQSRETWSWGSPDILPMFAKGSSGNHVHIHCYHGDTESFAGDDSSLLDTWVFDRFREFIDSAKHNSTLRYKLHQDKIVFFFHLLGLDSNGHSHKPMSSEYLSNINIVDEGINKTIQLMEDFFHHDGKTAFVFTSDHGMTNWGSHGAGHPSETLTPLVAWGAGVRSQETRGNDEISSNKFTKKDKELTRTWNLNPDNRYDIEQADVAALMSGLLGIPFPVNSVGSLPVDYLSGTPENRARLARANAKQIAEQFAVKMANVKEHAFAMFFHPFPDLSLSDVVHRDAEMADLITQGQYQNAIKRSKELLDLSLLGLRYYHTYDRTFLYLSVLSSFIGWIFVTVLLGVKQIDIVVSQAKKLRPIHEPSVFGYNSVQVLFGTLAACILFVLLLVRSPWTYYVYCLLPIPVWYSIVTDRYIIRAVCGLLAHNRQLFGTIIIYILVGLVGIWLMIGSFFNRYLLSLGLLGIAFMPRIFKKDEYEYSSDKLWTGACLLLTIFPLLPVVGRNPNMRLVLLGGCLSTNLSFLLSKFKPSHSVTHRNLTKMEQYVRPYFPIGCAVIVFLTSSQSTDSGSVSIIIHIISWTVLGLSWIAPTWSTTSLQDRSTSMHTWQMSAYILLSLSYDALFCVVLCALLHVWIYLEHSILKFEERGKHPSTSILEFDFQYSRLSLDDISVVRQPSLSDVRRSFLLVFFLVTAFFGVGNIASINSFDVRVVLPFVTVFDPFVMGALLAYKVLLPYLMVTCSFCGVALVTRMPLRTLCCIVMVISDVMAMHFVFMIQDYGSWLDIGTSISHFVIVMSMITSLLLFFIIANFLTKFSPKIITKSL